MAVYVKYLRTIKLQLKTHRVILGGRPELPSLPKCFLSSVVCEADHFHNGVVGIKFIELVRYLENY